MTEDDLDKLLMERLQESGVGKDDVDRSTSFLFSTPEGFLAEIVLMDASKLEQAEKAMEEAKGELESQSVSLLPTVRALWRVKPGSVTAKFSVKDLATFVQQRGPSLPFALTVESGSREEHIGVEVTPDAYGDLSYSGKCDIETLKKIVEAWVNSMLRVGGASRWDPRQDRWRQIDSGGVSYVFTHQLVNAA